MSYNISIEGPEDDAGQRYAVVGYTNALQLQSAFAYQSDPTPPYNHHAGLTNNSYTYHYNNSSAPFNDSPARPQLSQLTTALGLPVSTNMQQRGNLTPNTNYDLLYPQYFTVAEVNSMTPPVPLAWTPTNEPYTDPNSPSNNNSPYIASSPMSQSQGMSPLTPVTPNLTVDHPPSTAYPSPGSQGSTGSADLSPSSNYPSHPHTPASSHSMRYPIDLPESSMLSASPVPRRSAPLPETHHVQHGAPYTSDGSLSTSHYSTLHGYASQGYGTSSNFIEANMDVKPFIQSSQGPSTTRPRPATISVVQPSQSNTMTRHSHHNSAPIVPSRPAAPQNVIREQPQDGFGPFVPQKMYTPHTASDRRRYVQEAVLEPPIIFQLLNPQQTGIALTDAMTSRFIRLAGRDDPMFENRGPSISIRLVWEGYQPWSRQIPTRDFKSPPGPITKAKLAKNVAKSISRFIDEHADRELEAGVDTRWRVGGSGRINVEDLLLVSLHHVSMGSWQANLRLNRPL